MTRSALLKATCFLGRASTVRQIATAAPQDAIDLLEVPLPKGTKAKRSLDVEAHTLTQELLALSTHINRVQALLEKINSSAQPEPKPAPKPKPQTPRKLSAYQLFIKDRILSEGKGKTAKDNAERMKRLAAEWRGLSTEEKHRYGQSAAGSLAAEHPSNNEKDALASLIHS